MATADAKTYGDMRLLDAVKEVGELVNATDLSRVTQRPFDRARARSKNFSDCPPARRITEQLSTAWKKTLEVAAMTPRGRATALSHVRIARGEGWLTEEYVDHALRLVARRLGVDTLTPAVYWKEAQAMLAATTAPSRLFWSPRSSRAQTASPTRGARRGVPGQRP